MKKLHFFLEKSTQHQIQLLLNEFRGLNYKNVENFTKIALGTIVDDYGVIVGDIFYQTDFHWKPEQPYSTTSLFVVERFQRFDPRNL